MLEDLYILNVETCLQSKMYGIDKLTMHNIMENCTKLQRRTEFCSDINVLLKLAKRVQQRRNCKVVYYYQD